MQNVESKIKSFQDLAAWQEAHKLVLMTYDICKKFPPSENYALSSQIKRAVISVTSNIAEGFTRDTYADKSHFYIMAHASLTEVQNQLLAARDLSYVPSSVHEIIYEQSEISYRILSGLIRATKERR